MQTIYIVMRKNTNTLAAIYYFNSEKEANSYMSFNWPSLKYFVIPLDAYPVSETQHDQIGQFPMF